MGEREDHTERGDEDEAPGEETHADEPDDDFVRDMEDDPSTAGEPEVPGEGLRGG